MADALLLVGVALVCVGVGLWSVPAAVVTTGVFCCTLGILSARRPGVRK